jgi:hypothetical protein
MASHEEAPYEEVSYAEPEWDWGSELDADSYEDPYADTYVRWPETEPPIRRPWHRNPLILLGLIAAASVPLSVAAVLLLTDDRDADVATKLKPTIRTTAVMLPPSESASQTSAAESTPQTSAEETTATESAAEIPAATIEVPAPLPSARGGETDESDGPRINVTRSPMSFTPGTRG